MKKLFTNVKKQQNELQHLNLIINKTNFKKHEIQNPTLALENHKIWKCNFRLLHEVYIKDHIEADSREEWESDRKFDRWMYRVNEQTEKKLKLTFVVKYNA